jgi:integrase
MARRGKNEGTIFRKANGSWRAQVSIDGRRLSFTAKTRADCRDWLRTMLDQIDQGLTYEGRNQTLSEYLDEWIAVKKNVVRPKTVFQYQRLINLYISTALGKMKLKDLNLRVINRFYDGLVSKGVGLSNIGYAHRVLHGALEQAVKNGVLGRNPAHGAIVPKMRPKEMRILNEQQVGLFLVSASQSRYRALYHLAVTTGMRFSELRGLAWSDVDWIKGTITVNKQIQDVPRLGSLSGPTKTHSGNRTILLGETYSMSYRSKKGELRLIV